MSWPRAVLFDLDYTLWHPPRDSDGEALNRSAARRLLPVLAGFGFDEAACLDLVRAFWDRFPAIQATTGLREVDLCVVLHALLRERNAAAPLALAARVRHALCLPARKAGIRVYPDALATLAWLKRRGLGVAVVTNRLFWRRRQDLRDLGLDHLVDVLVVSEDVGFRKPHPLPFKEALRRLGCEPSDALMVGDSYEADIMGARSAGIPVALKLNDREDRQEWPADFKLRDLAELPRIIVAGDSYAMSAESAACAPV